jgi:hypothetical protein
MGRQVATALADRVNLFGVAIVEEADQVADLGRDILLLGPHRRASA